MRAFGFFFFCVCHDLREEPLAAKGEVMSFVIAGVVVCMRADFAKKEAT